VIPGPLLPFYKPSEIQEKMKKLPATFSQLRQTLREWLFPTKESQQKTKQIRLTLTEQAELLQLCCKLFGKTESVVRKEIRNLCVNEIQTEREDIIPRRNFKGLRVECEDYALWLDFSTLDNKERKEKQWLYCYHLWLFYTGEKNNREFSKALEDEEEYTPLWENCYVDSETNRIKIIHSQEPSHPVLPYHMAFTLFRTNK